MTGDTGGQFEAARSALAALVDDETRADLGERHPDDRVLRVSWQDLAAWELGNDPGTDAEYHLDDVSGLASDVVARPESTLEALNQALAELKHPETGRPLAGATVRLEGLPERASAIVGSYSPSVHLGRLVELEGQITKRTDVLPCVRLGAFECQRCGTLTRVSQPDWGGLREPFECQGCDRQGPFRLNDDQSEWADYQKFRLQQPPEHAAGETKNIDAHAFTDLAGRDVIEGGARVSVTARLAKVFTGKVVHDKCLVVNEVTPEQDIYGDEDFARHQNTIDRLKADPDRFEKLVASLAPNVEGNWQVKQALTLQAFTGGSWHAPDGSHQRADSHIKLIGDPGTGKSLLLEALSERVPIATLTDATQSSGVGLTASITKDDFADEQFSIEAGTLVRASGGKACIDELDKGDEDDLEKLHTALESQEVRVSKAGKKAILPAETGVLAAANPTGGHFDPRKEFTEQVDLQSPLLSRFDLILVMREWVEEDRVRSLADMVVDSWNLAGRAERGDLDDTAAEDARAPLSAEEFRAYVASAKRLQPTVEDEGVRAEIKDWYASLKTGLPNRYRRAAQTEEQTGDYPDDAPPLPITARKVGAMLRLAAASARIRHSERIEMVDVDRARPLIKRSLADIGIAPSDNEAFAAVSSDVDPSEVGLQ